MTQIALVSVLLWAGFDLFAATGLLSAYSASAVRVNKFADDEDLSGWEFETTEKFDPEIILHDIQNYFAEKYEDVKIEHMA